MAGQMGIYHLADEEPTPAEFSEQLAREAFVGKHLTQLTRHGGIDPECGKTGPSAVQCTYWTDNAILHSRGRSVDITLDTSGKVAGVSVKEVKRILFW